MSATISQLDQVVPDPAELTGDGSEDHPMRRVTRQVAFEPEGWTPERADKVTSLFDSLAPEWHTRMRPGRLDSLVDGLQRGGFDAPPPSTGSSTERGGLVVELGSGTGFATPLLIERFGAGRVVELGSGTGFATPLLIERFGAGRVVAMDLSAEMLARAPAVAPRVRADASRLPLRDGAVSTLVLVNMLLFPSEVDRVLGHDGALLWVNSLAELTPIHLSAEDVGRALPGKWEGVAARAGGGTWCVLRRHPS